MTGLCACLECADVGRGCVPVLSVQMYVGVVFLCAMSVLLCMCIAGLQWLFYNFAGAVHRYYESRRRRFLDSQPEC